MQRYLPALDGVRALAIAIVLAAHGGVAWFRSGGVGVDLFFVLSGFLITSILAAEVAATGRIGFRNFYARRLLRLAPCLLLTCAFVAVARQVTTGQVPWSALVIALTYTANWVRAFSDADLSWLIHCWTLAIEEQFYLLWPPLLLLLERRVRDARTKGFLLVSAALLVAVYRAGMVGLYSDGLDTAATREGLSRLHDRGRHHHLDIQAEAEAMLQRFGKHNDDGLCALLHLREEEP